MKFPNSTNQHMAFVPVVRGQNKLEVRAEGERAELVLIGAIGKSYWDDSGITEQEVRDALKTIPKGKKIDAKINSEGGSVKEGLGIYNAFKDRREDITAHITGYALSIASIFPLGAGKVVSPKSAIWMMHKAWSWNQGNADDMRQAAEMLDAHDETLAEIYASETGKTKAEILSAMESETWIKGADAVAYGLADESDPEEQEASAGYRPIAKDFLSRCKNISPEILNALASHNGPGAPTHSAAQAGGQPNPTKENTTMNKAKIVALLITHGIKNADGKDLTETSTDAEFETALNTLAKKSNADASAKMEAIEAKLAIAEKRRITDKINTYVDAQKITKAEVSIFVAAAMTDESGTLAILDAKEVSGLGGEIAGAEFGANRIEVIDGADFGDLKGPKSEALINIQKQHKTPEARYAAKKSEWKRILDAACRKDSSMGREVFAANTYSGTLVTSFLMDGSVTDLQNVWAMLKAFSMDFSTDPYKPLATGVLKHVTAGASTQTDATNFESGNSTVAPVSVTMHQYSQSFQVSNSDLNSGLRMADLVKINTANFANKIIEVATVPITVALFTATPLVSAAAAFGFSDLATLQGQLKKSPIKNLILDGNYIARIANTPGFFQQAGVVGGNTGAWKAFGWDTIAQNTDWTGAGANMVGFACNPQAIAGITGLPLVPPSIPGGIYASSTATIPGLEASILVSTWFNPATRTMWSGLDIMAGFKEVDTTAGICITSA